ncbi:SpoIIE family protein phosphatase [Streptomyces sp. NPDC005962]|uniref:SpoIIE family protein phosphatase n=1 Tax=Streptomyces sp. NPDC005962 TaxID=3154466 RepID=UPI0033ED757D
MSGDSRIDMLMAAGERIDAPEALRIGLDQAVAGVGGLGGMVHLGGGGSGHLYLATRCGLSESLTEAWKRVGGEEPVAPALAVRDNALVWTPLIEDGESGGRTGGRAFPLGSGLVSVPLPASRGPQGALTVLTAARDGPGPAERSLLTAVAGWLAERLHEPTLPQGGPPGWTWPTRSDLQRSRSGSGVGTWAWDFATGTVHWDETALALLGAGSLPASARVEEWMDIVHPQDLPQVLAAAEAAIHDRGTYSAAYRVRRPDGRYSRVRARGHLLSGDDGTPYRMLGSLQDATAGPSGPPPEHIEGGSLTLDGAWRVTRIDEEAERLLAPDAPPVGTVPWQSVPALRALGLEAACRQAVADGRPLTFDAKWPATLHLYRIRLVPVPGGVTVHVTDATQERVSAHPGEDRATRLEELAGSLAAAATVDDVIDALADRVLPLFGAIGLLVQLVEGARLVTAGSRGYSDEFIALLADPGHPRENPLTVALRSAIPTFVSSPEEFVRRYPELAHLPTASGKQAWAFLPLIVSGDAIGYCSVSFDHPRTLSGEERTLLTALGGLTAQALARARLYDAEHRHAQELQRGLLPRSLPELPAATASARYLPASASAEVGGDWYDLIPLSGGRVALVIGDVMGHGLSEAATMGRLRTAVHTLADLELPPGELLFHLNDLVSGLGDDFYATCLYIAYDPTRHLCSIARAGHPPPAVVRADGTVFFPDLPVVPPLGAATPPFDTCELALPDEALLVLYTDGLVETADRDIQQGMADLARSLTTAVRGTPPGESADPDRLCDTLLSTLLPPEQHTDDDAALLVARLRPLPAEDIATWSLPEDPRAAGQARAHVRGQLGAWHLDDLTTTTELLVSELVGNVVRHAQGPIGLRLLRSRAMICEVSDGSPATPRIRRAGDLDEGGRGLQLVAALAHRWGARYTAQGKCIWTEQLLT